MTKTNIEILEKEIDEYLVELRKELFEGWANGADCVEFVETLIRAAYAKGIHDALRNPEHFKEWIVSHGYTLPKPV